MVAAQSPQASARPTRPQWLAAPQKVSTLVGHAHMRCIHSVALYKRTGGLLAFDIHIHIHAMILSCTLAGCGHAAILLGIGASGLRQSSVLSQRCGSGSTSFLALAGMTDYNQEMRSNMWKGQLDGNPDVEEEIAAGDKEGDEVCKSYCLGLCIERTIQAGHH